MQMKFLAPTVSIYRTGRPRSHAEIETVSDRRISIREFQDFVNLRRRWITSVQVSFPVKNKCCFFAGGKKRIYIYMCVGVCLYTTGSYLFIERDRRDIFQATRLYFRSLYTHLVTLI